MSERACAKCPTLLKRKQKQFCSVACRYSGPPRFCGKCGVRLGRHQIKFCCPEHVREARQLWMQDMRQRYTYTLRRGRFQRLVLELIGRGKITHEGLLAFAAQAYRIGYHTSEKKWNERAKVQRVASTKEQAA